MSALEFLCREGFGELYLSVWVVRDVKGLLYETVVVCRRPLSAPGGFGDQTVKKTAPREKLTVDGEAA